MRTTAKKIGVLLVGWSFILFGLVGLILPILHGTLFLLIGVAILSSEYVWAHRLLSTIRDRFPSVTVRLEHATTTAHEWINNAFHRRDPPVE
jgi:uncharacterized membrane protein YbaN (DUF454 family)